MTPPQFETLYLAVFAAAALALLAVERLSILRREPATVARRWISNMGLLLIGSLLAGVLLPAGLFAFAAQRPPGLVAALGMSVTGQVALTLLLLDLWRYVEHRILHGVPLLWRCHLVHHSDTQLDVTTSERHHPLEVLLDMAAALLVVAALGLPAIGVALYLLVAVVFNLWSHANVRLPEAIDRALRRIVVTPSVHALHHSRLRAQTDSNFGAVLTVWDRLFGTYLDPAHAPLARYGLDYFHLPEDARLGHVLQQPFRYRPGKSASGEREPTPASGPSTRHPRALTGPAKAALRGAIAGTVLVSLAMAPTWLQLFKLWQQEAYQYAWLVVPTVAYLIATRRGGLQHAIDPRPDFSGMVVVIVAALAWCAGALTSIDLAQQFALVLALQGVAMCAVGFAAYRTVFPVLALLFLLIPAGDVLLPLLMKATVKAMEVFPILAGLPYRVDGFVITVAARHYVVVDACSGLVLVSTATFLAYSLGLLLFRSLGRVLVLTLFSAVLAFLCNAARVNTIVIIDYLRGSQMELAAHTPIQWVALAALLAGLFYVVYRVAGDGARKRHAPPPGDDVSGPRKLAPVIAGAAALLLTTAVAALLANEPAIAQTAHAPAPPSVLAGWTLRTQSGWSTDDAAGTRSLRMIYARDERTFDAVLVEAKMAGVKLPESRITPDDGVVWHKRAVDAQASCAQGRCVDVVHASWVREEKTRWRHAYYIYSTGNFESGSKLAVRVMQGWQRLTRSPAMPRLVGLVADADLDPAEVAAALQALVALDTPSVRSALD